MEYRFLHKEQTGRLIIIFAGWSTDADFYRHIHVGGWDILVVYGYTSLDFPTEILDDYHTVVLFAWSLGVFMADRVIPADKIALAVAVNGTVHPVDDLYGIPENIFKATAATLSQRNLEKFRRRMCGKSYSDIAHKFSPSQSGETETSSSKHGIMSEKNLEVEENINRLRRQLEFIAALSAEALSPMNNLRWHRAYVSDQDAIFPPLSQQRAWEAHPSHPEIIRLDQPHYVDLEKIISSAIPAKEKVGKRFHRALSTYDRQAIAQKAIARHLNDFPGGVPIPPEKVLEIGPGTGIFTRLFADRFHPERIDYIDLYPLPEYNVAEVESYFSADAEDWVAEKARNLKSYSSISNLEGKDRVTDSRHNNTLYDAVISASALQWFANPEAFFRNVADILRPGGFLLCSTFLPGNLAEMQSANPYGLIYRSAEELEKLIKKYFLFAKLEEEELIIDFDSPLDTLRHLKDTGVGGGLDTGHSPRKLLESIPLRLTYRPLYIYAVKDSRESPPANDVGHENQANY